MSKGEDDDREYKRLIAAGAPSTDTLMQALEGAEQVYYQAVVATSLPDTVTVSAATPCETGVNVE